MSYSLNQIFKDFKNELIELDRIVISLSTEKPSIERDTHIEGCFIRFVVSWENFVEEYFLRCMCGARTRNSQDLKPLRTPFRNTNEAFKRININRKDREKDYVDWLDTKLVQQRINDYFRKNSRVYKICESPDKLYELKTIRNAIAHRSKSAILKFEKYVKDQMGYLASLNPTMSSLLIQKRKNSNKYIFTILTSYFIELSDKLTK